MVGKTGGKRLAGPLANETELGLVRRLLCFTICHGGFLLSPEGIVWLANPILSDLPGNRRSSSFNYFSDTARFRVANADWWKTEALAELDMWLGGEPAAAVLTKHLRPEVTTIYGDAHFATLARRIQPAKDEHGNLELLQKFWQFDLPRADKRYPLAPPLLIYADLVATADARNIETAQIIRERFLAKA